MKEKKDKKKTLIIILLLILLGLAGAYILFGPNGYSANQQGREFLDDVLELQSTLSYYVGSSYSDAFGVYTKEELLFGKTADGEQINDYENNLLPELITQEGALDYDEDSKAYKLNMPNVETTLGINIADYEGVTFYVVEGDIVKVQLDGKPDWWNSNYDGLILE